MSQSRWIKVTRTVVYKYTVEWPTEFPDMSFADALTYEREMDTPTVIEAMNMAAESELELSVNIEY